MHRKWSLAAGLALLVAAAGYGWWWREQHRQVAQASRPVSAPARVEAEVSLQGKIQAKNVVDVGAPIDGILEQYLVDAGEEVFEGEVLARIKNTGLDSVAQSARADAERAQSRANDLESELIAARLELSRARSDVVRAKAEYERTEKVYQRQKMLLDVGATPRLTFEKAEKDYQNAKSDYNGFEGTAQNEEDRVATLAKEIESAKAMVLAKSKDVDNVETQIAGGELRSPVNGLVVSRRGRAGDMVDQGMKDLLQIAVDLSALQVVVDPDPRAVQQIRQGQAALIEVAEAASAIQGTVREVKAGQVFVDFTSPSPVIKPGLTAQVKIKLG